ncbi:MAG: outer membrane beta-barrel protein [Butyricimonas faecihominis]
MEGFSYLPAGADTPVTGERDDNFSWTGKIIANAMLPYAISLQATGSYNSKQIIAQGHREASYRLDLGARKFFFDRKINLSISVQDILNSRSWHSITSGNGFKQIVIGEKAGFPFHVSYNFGNMKAPSKKQRPSEEINMMEEEF